MTITDAHASPAPALAGALSSLWAEITGKCQLSFFWTNAVTASSQRMKSGVG